MDADSVFVVVGGGGGGVAGRGREDKSVSGEVAILQKTTTTARSISSNTVLMIKVMTMICSRPR